MWSKILLEWINCLDVLEANIKDLKELNDGKVYKKLIELFSWEGIKNILDTDDVVSKFIQNEYPEYEYNDKDLEGKEHVYTASLFLLRASQESLFQDPMCDNLQHETQVKIKAFLEGTMPYGRVINKETLRNVIAKIEDGWSICLTPSRTLTQFFTSPAMRSVDGYKLLTAKNRELRMLKSELEVERIDKADMQEDLKIQQNKIQSLQKELREKMAEIKALKQERVREQTPEPCEENKNETNSERHYRKEIDRLEDKLGEKQCEIHNLEKDNETLKKKMACVKQQCGRYKEKIENYERMLEHVEHQIEIKDRELANLRMTNEELRDHIKGAVVDQSFEIDGVVPFDNTLSTSLLNHSETMSTVIEIQLQEAKEESALLKTQLEASNMKLESTAKMYKNAMKTLEEKTQVLRITELKLNETINNLNKKIDSLEKEKNSLTIENKNLEALCTSQKESLLLAEQLETALTDEVNTLKGRIKDLEETVSNENVNNAKLSSEIAEVESRVNDNLKRIEALTEQNNLYKTSINLYSKNLKEIVLNYLETDCSENLDDNTVDGLIERVQTILCNFDRKYNSIQMELKSTNSTIEETNLKAANFESRVSQLQEKDEQNIAKIKELQEKDEQDIAKIKELQEKDEQNIAKIKELRETITNNTTRVNELDSIIKKNSEEILRLRQIELQKEALEKDTNDYKREINRQNALIQTSEKRIEALKKNIETVKAEFFSMRKDILNQINEQQKYNEEKDKNILNTCKLLYASYTEDRLSNDELRLELAYNEKELKASRNLSVELENELERNKEIIRIMETKLTNTEEKLENAIKMEEILEEQRDQLRSENEKILLDLNDVNVKLGEAKREMHSASDKLNIEEQKISGLIEDIDNLKSEIEREKQLRAEWEMKTKDFVKKLERELRGKQVRLDQLEVLVKAKEKNLELVQDKYNKLLKSIISETKMKEVITNLQEVRSNQDAVLKTQEKALKERCLQLEQLQKEYEEIKGMHEKQLRELHDKYKSKVDEIKQNMKAAYNEQIKKLNKDQEQSVQERLESLQKKMELQLSKYKAHVTDMSSRYWDIGDKLLSEQRERERLQKELTELKAKCRCSDRRILSSIENKISKYEQKGLGEGPDDVLQKITTIHEQSTYERRYSIRSIQAMGNAFNAEDEEGEVPDNIYLTDVRDSNSTFDADRLSILKKRNALCKPHLKSSYPAEMQFHPLPFSEEEIKTGSADDVFNDSLSQSLLPEQKVRKKDKTQSSYKKPGPPTPAKNGGRLSLQNNELKSPNSKALRDRNKDRITTTPGRLRSLFTSRRQNETVIITPKSRRSSIFRKYRNINDR